MPRDNGGLRSKRINTEKRRNGEQLDSVRTSGSTVGLRSRPIATVGITRYANAPVPQAGARVPCDPYRGRRYATPSNRSPPLLRFSVLIPFPPSPPFPH